MIVRHYSHTDENGKLCYKYYRGDMCPACKGFSWVKGHPCGDCDYLGVVGEVKQISYEEAESVTRPKAIPKPVISERKRKLFDLFK